MYPIILIAMYYVLSHPFFVNGQEIELSFNTRVYEGTNRYYAHIGEDVVLNCSFTREEALVNMDRGGSRSSEHYERLVVNGKLVGDLANQMDKYSFQSRNGHYQLTIKDLKKSDSLPYLCRFRCKTQCGVCLPWFCRVCTEWCSRLEEVRLDVKETNDDSTMPDSCDLINNTDGIFFTGNNLTLRCPQLSMNLTASNGRVKFIVDFQMEDYSDTFSLLTVKSLTPKFNGTTLSCISAQNDAVSGKDYCRSFLPILVFNNITVLLLGGEREITNGENVTFTCHSYPFLPLTIQWDILDSNVSFVDMFISEIDQGSNITFIDLQFLDSSSSNLTVFCNVTIGSESGSVMTSIFPRTQVISSTQATSFLSEISSTQVTLSEAMSVPQSDMPSFSPVSIVAPVIVVIGVLTIIVLGIFYIKLRKPVSSNETDRRNGNVNQNTVHVEDNVYITRNTEGTELGLTYHDSEVADNVAYVSYDEDYKRG